MAKLLLVAFDDAEGLMGSGFAQALGEAFDVLFVTGQGRTDLGAGEVLVAGLDQVPPADGIAKALSPFCVGYSLVAAVSNMRSKDIMARIAGLLDAAMVTDVIGCSSPSVFQRPIVAGSIIATVEVLSEPVVLTVRPAGFAFTPSDSASAVKPITLATTSKARRTHVTARGGGRPDLAQAKVVVSGGRPLKDAETFERLVGGLADALGGAVGATRAAVDSGIAANELQVGQTGKIVAPDLYIAAGISGSTQHMAGIKDSKVIVAINKDPDASIFEAADYGIVADLYDVLPELTQKVK